MNKPTTILVAEYSEGMRHLLSSILEREGYTVIPARSLFETLETVRAKPPDAVVISIDFLVPQGGWIAGEQIWEIAPELPVLFVAGWEGEVPEVPEETLKGPHAVLSDPFRGEELVKALKKLLSREK